MITAFSISKGSDLAVTFNVSHYQNGNNISCNGATDGMVEAVIVGGTSPYTYSWNTGSFNRVLTGLGTGVYTFTVTDANSQTVSSSVELIEPKLLEVTLVSEIYGGYNISEQGGSNGNIAVDVKGGSMPYFYSWSNGSTEKSLNGLSAGTYNVIVTDVNGCSKSGSKALTEPTPLHIVSITSPIHRGYNVSCYYGSDGQIDLTVAGGVPPYKYDWSTGSFNEDLVGLSAGEYSVRISDANEIEITTSIQLTQPTKLDLVLTPQVYSNGFNLSCHDCANGSLTALCTNGVSPYTYVWSNSQTTPTISALQATDYKCSVTDANGCTLSAAKLLTAPDRDDWSMNGNANTNSATQFMGTTDNKDFVFKTNSVERMRIKGFGNIEITSGLKIDSVSTDSLRVVYVDQNGLLRSNGGSGCDWLANAWFANHCNLYTGNIYLKPSLNNVGFGTTLPRDKIEVVGNGRFVSSSDNTKFLLIGHNGSNSTIEGFGVNPIIINQQSGNDVQICNGSSGDLLVGGNTTLALSRGSVGIGKTPNPFYSLDVLSKINAEGYYLNGSHLVNWLINLNGEIQCDFSNNRDLRLPNNLHLNGASISIGENDGISHSGSTNYRALIHGYQDELILNSSTGAFNGVTINSGSTNGITLNSIPSGTQIFLNGRVKIVNFGLATKKELLFRDNNDEISSLQLDNDDKKVLVSDGTWRQSSELSVWQSNDGTNIFNSNTSGCVGIGITSFPSLPKTWPLDYKLAVNGSIIATELKIQLQSSWADYVFDPEYRLMPIKKLSEFVKENGHLPDVPSQKEVSSNNGFDVGKMNVTLLKKIEELTLYLIQQEEKIKMLEEKVSKINGSQFK